MNCDEFSMRLLAEVNIVISNRFVQGIFMVYADLLLVIRNVEKNIPIDKPV